MGSQMGSLGLFLYGFRAKIDTKKASELPDALILNL